MNLINVLKIGVACAALVFSYWIGAWAIGALSLNELISILENVEKAGFGSIIPQRIRDMLELVKEEHQNKIKSKLPLGDKSE